MKKHLLILQLFLIALSFCSCEKFSDDEAYEAKDANSTLVIRTRAAYAEGTGEESPGEISYPVNVYIFDNSGKCVEVSKIASGDDALSLKMPEGKYDVYAVAGADADSYDLPTKGNATKDAVLELKEGQSHGDLMTAHNSVTLAYGEVNKLTLALERKVIMLESVVIKSVPSNVEGVSVSLSPLREHLLLNGNYSGENGEHVVALSGGTGDGTWKSAEPAYLLEAAGTATVKVSFTVKGTVHSYSYTCAEELNANHKVSIEGTFNGDGLDLVGTITGATWEEPVNIVFTFGSEGTETVVTPDDDGQQPNTDVPTEGELYKGCYVLRSATSGNETVYTLMTAKELKISDFEEGNNESLEEAVNAGIAELSISDIPGWRLANEEEINYVKEHWEDIVDDFDRFYEEKIAEVDYFNATNLMLYWDGTENEIKSYNVKSGKTPQTPKPNDILRAFTTVTISN